MFFEILLAFLIGAAMAVGGGVYLVLYLMDSHEPSAAEKEKDNASKESQSKESSSKDAKGATKTPTEDSAWFGVVLQRWFDEQAQSVVLTAHYQQRLTHLFNKAVSRSSAFASRVESIECKDLTLGSKCAALTRFSASTMADGAARVTFDLDYRGGAQFAIHLVLKLKLPFRKLPTRIPARLTVKITAMRGHMALIIPTGAHPLLQLAFVSEPTSEFDVSSQVGGSFRFSNLKRLHTFIISRLEAQIRKDFVEPTGLCFNIPVKDEIKLQLRPLRSVMKTREAEATAAAAAALAAIVNAKKAPPPTPDQSVPEDALAAELDQIGDEATATDELAPSATASAASTSATAANALAGTAAAHGEHRGWLLKRGNLRHNWKRRFFVLHHDRAEYFGKELVIGEPPLLKGSFELAGCRVELAESTAKDKGKVVVVSDGDHENVETRDALFPFNVVSPDRTWRLKAESAELRDAWMSHFVALIDAANGGGAAAMAAAAKAKKRPPLPPKKPQLLDHGAAASALVTAKAMALADSPTGRPRNLTEATSWSRKSTPSDLTASNSSATSSTARVVIGTRGGNAAAAAPANTSATSSNFEFDDDDDDDDDVGLTESDGDDDGEAGDDADVVTD